MILLLTEPNDVFVCKIDSYQIVYKREKTLSKKGFTHIKWSYQCEFLISPTIPSIRKINKRVIASIIVHIVVFCLSYSPSISCLKQKNELSEELIRIGKCYMDYVQVTWCDEAYAVQMIRTSNENKPHTTKYCWRTTAMQVEWQGNQAENERRMNI